MTAERDTERIVRSWLEVGVTALPDHILDAVLDQVPATPQRRPIWPSRRFAQMPTALKLGLGAVAVVLVAVAGYALLPGTAGVGGPGPTPSASPTATPIALKQSDVNHALPVGMYHTANGFAAPFSMTVPAGWTPVTLNVGENTLIGPANTKGQQPSFGAFVIERVSVNPCAESPSPGTSPSPPPGRPIGTASEIVAALGAMTDFQASSVTNVTVGGYPALRVDLTNTVDASKCVGGALIPIWTERGGIPVSTNPGMTEHLWVVDRPSGPVILIGEFTDLAAQDQATIQAIVDSVDFD